MSRKKRRESQPWWRKRGIVRRAAIAGSLAAAVVLVVWVFVSFGGGGEGAMSDSMSDDPAMEGEAPSFTLPTVTGGDVSLADYLGQDVLLLYFNEGVG